MSDEPEDQELANRLAELVGERRPVAVVGMFVLRALGQHPYDEIPIEELVTPESQANWNEEELSSILRGHAFYTGADYLSPEWARVLLPQAQEGEEPHLVDESREVPALAFYLRYDEALKDWRVHLLGSPDLSVKELP